MAFIERLVSVHLQKATRHFPALILTGPRQAGKTTLLRRLYPRASYTLMEDSDVVARVRSDPPRSSWKPKTPAILDEIQNVTLAGSLFIGRPKLAEL